MLQHVILARRRLYMPCCHRGAVPAHDRTPNRSSPLYGTAARQQSGQAGAQTETLDVKPFVLAFRGWTPRQEQTIGLAPSNCRPRWRCHSFVQPLHGRRQIK